MAELLANSSRSHHFVGKRASALPDDHILPPKIKRYLLTGLTRYKSTKQLAALSEVAAQSTVLLYVPAQTELCLHRQSLVDCKATGFKCSNEAWR